MIVDLLFYLLSDRLARAGQTGTRPEESEAVLQQVESALRSTPPEGVATENAALLRGSERELIAEYLRTYPELLPQETHDWFLERMARDTAWVWDASPGDLVLRYISTVDPFGRFLAAAAQLSATTELDGRASAAAIADALLTLGADEEGAEAELRAPTPRERADRVAELTEIVLDLTLNDLERSSATLTEIAERVRRNPAVQEYDPVGRVVRSRADVLGGTEGELLRAALRR